MPDLTDINRDHLLRRRDQAARSAVAAQNAIRGVLARNRDRRFLPLSDLATIASDATEAAAQVAMVQAFDVALATLDADRKDR